jgi:hypothetical protein
MSLVWESEIVTEKTETLVLLALADWADDGGKCYPAISSIARKSRQSERNVRYVLRSLKDRGLVTWEENRGRSATNLYRINLQALQGATLAGVQTATVKPAKALHPNHQEPSDNTLSKSALDKLPSVPSRHPAVAAYLDTFEGYRLDNYQTDIVRQTIGDDPDRLQAWIKTLTDWRLSGWSARSIPLMLDKFQRTTDTRRHETDSGLVRTGTANHASGARRGPGGGRPTAAERSGGLTAAEVIDGANSALAILRANAGGSL